MREIDLSSYRVRTDLIVDILPKLTNIKGVKEEIITKEDITISNIIIDEEGEAILAKPKGYYSTIYFDDVTDNTNKKKVLESLKDELIKIFSKTNIKEEDSCLIIGLGNEKSTPDSLGAKVVKDIIVTKHIYDLVGSLEDNYRVVSAYIPGVMGTSGIETSDIVKSLIEITKASFLIVIDALASDSIDRVCKTIQITNTGITPGSGIGNRRKEISKKTVGVDVIAIGVPVVTDASTIVTDTINYMLKHFSYNLKNKNNLKNKLIPSHRQNYLLEKDLSLTSELKKYYLGVIGTLSDFEMKALIYDVLTPIGYNLMVTPKEIDYQIEQLAKIISQALNNTIHNTNNI